jgi:bla regulator protein blaR1
MTAMENILFNISQVLGLTIINSLWQGLLVYFVLRVILMFSGNLSSSKKYVLACSSLLAITVWFFYTLIKQIYLFDWLATVPLKLTASPLMLALPAGIHQVDDQTLRYYYNIEGLLPYVAAVYLLGLIFNTFKIISDNKKLQLIRKAATIDLALQQQVKRFTKKLGISKHVSIGLSELVSVPCMTGYIKPMILLPLTLQTYLSASEIEAIVLHELAHIKRDDYLLNILQQVIAILLFFNPCAQLISKIINEERENSCDDLVVKAEAEPLTYAKALLKLAQNSQSDRKLALAATGKKYHLLNRIERIMKTNKQQKGTRPALLAMLIFTVMMGGIALLNPQIAQGKISVKAIRPVLENFLADTGKKQLVAKTHPKTKHVTKHEKDFDDAKMDALNAKIQQYSDAVSQYYSTQAYKDMQEKIEELGKNVQSYYDNPDAKRIEEEIGKLSINTQKLSDDNKMNDISKEISDKALKISAYYTSPEFVQLNESLKKKYGITSDYNDDRDPNYKKYQAELESRIPANVKLTQDEVNKLGKQMTGYYEGPELTANNARIKELSDSLKVIYSNPQIKVQQKELEALGRQIRNYSENPEIKKQQALLNKYAKEMAAYVQSEVYKDYVKHAADYQDKYGNGKSDNDKPEKDDQDKSDDQ